MNTIAVHNDERHCACHLCGKTFKLKESLSTHIAQVHDKKRPHKCEFCGKHFFSLGHLKRHHDVHGDIRPHDCHVCDAKFKRSHHLTTHLRTIHDITNKSKKDLDDLKLPSV